MTETSCPVSCTFTYHSVVPPTHCPYCGRCLGCGAPQVAPYRPYNPWIGGPYAPTYWQTIEVTSNTTPKGTYSAWL